MIKNLNTNDSFLNKLLRENKEMIIEFKEGKITGKLAAKEIDEINLLFMKDNNTIMDRLKNGEQLHAISDGMAVRSSLDDKIVGRGFSIASSVEDLEDKINPNKDELDEDRYSIGR